MIFLFEYINFQSNRNHTVSSDSGNVKRTGFFFFLITDDLQVNMYMKEKQYIEHMQR